MTVVTLPAWLLRKQANAEAQETRAETVDEPANVPTPLTQVLPDKAASRREYMRVYMRERRAKEKAAKA